MKLVLRVLAFSLCLVATYSAANFTIISAPKTAKTAPMPTCPPSNPYCSML